MANAFLKKAFSPFDASGPLYFDVQQGKYVSTQPSSDGQGQGSPNQMTMQGGGDPSQGMPPGGAPGMPPGGDPGMPPGGAPGMPPGGGGDPAGNMPVTVELLQQILPQLMEQMMAQQGMGGGQPGAGGPGGPGGPAGAGGKAGKEQAVLQAIQDLRSDVQNLVSFLTGVQMGSQSQGGPPPSMIGSEGDPSAGGEAMSGSMSGAMSGPGGGSSIPPGDIAGPGAAPPAAKAASETLRARQIVDLMRIVVGKNR